MLTNKPTPRSSSLSSLNTENVHAETSCAPSSQLGKHGVDLVGADETLSRTTISSNYQHGGCLDGPSESRQTCLDKHWLVSQHVGSSDGEVTPRVLSPIDSNASTTPVARSYTPFPLPQAVKYNDAESWSSNVKEDVISSWLRSIDDDAQQTLDKALRMGSSLDGPTSPSSENED
ncbi:uncharacterized protein PG998_001640 [Apiospora kogelbergensis]|uniref:Uncharacterized protein n=1 Tax=Apiospora kogelbergensis TaxID=1337665 RepID=A0AAW0QP06_9PEZI